MNGSPFPIIETLHQLGGCDESIPYTISPRMTLLLNGEPRLRWNQVPDVNSYLVRIMKDSEVYWQEKVCGTEIRYPGDPPLCPGVDYLLTVETGNGKSSLDGGEPKLGFKLLDRDIAQAIQNAAERLENSDMPDEEKALTLAAKYNRFHLNADALKTLEEFLVKNGSDTAAVCHLLGNICAETGNNWRARRYYEQAIVLARSTGEVIVLREAQAGLNGVKLMLRNNELVTPQLRDICCFEDRRWCPPPPAFCWRESFNSFTS